MTSQMKISASYIDFNSTIEKAMVDISTDVYQTVKPIIKEIIINGETITENLVQFEIVDDRMSYNWKYEFDKYEMKQFIKLLQTIQAQMNLESIDGNAGYSSRPLQIK